MDNASKLLAALVAVLADPLATAVAERLRPVLLPSASDVYSSHKLPPDVRSKDRFHRVVRHVSGARRDGRVWIVSRASWEAHRTRRKSEGRAPEPTEPISVDVEADELLSAAGLRRSLKAIAGGRR